MQNSKIQTVLIDPQGIANKWLRKQYAKEITFVNMDHAKYVQDLIHAMKFGLTVLLENVDEVIPRELYPIFRLNRQQNNMQTRTRVVILDN